MTQENSLVIISFIAVIIVTVIIRLLSGKKENRYTQFPVLVASAVYATAAFIACIAFIRQLTGFAENLGVEAMYVPILLNTVILVGFLLIKVFFRLPLGKKGATAAAQKFYRYDDDTEAWLLMKKWVNYAVVSNAVSFAILAVTAITFVVISVVAVRKETILYVYPSVLLIIATEFALFLGGISDNSPDKSSVSGLDSDHIHLGQYFRLCGVLEKMFPAELLSSHFGCEYSEKSGASHTLSELKKSDDRLDRIVAAHYMPLITKRDLNVDAILASAKMLKGKSVIFNSPFYRDMSDYISLPLTDTLLSGKKCLVITGRSYNSLDVQSWINMLIQDYCHIHSLWMVERLGKKAVSADVGIISAKELYDLDALKANREFFGDVQLVLLLEPSLMLITGQVGLSIICDEVHAGGLEPVFCICDRTAVGLVDTLSHLLHTELVEVSATPVPHNNYSSMLWDADGDYARQRIFEKQTQYMGGGVELAAVAVRNQIPHVTWVSETRTPLRDIQWLAGQNYAAICRYMNKPVHQKTIDDKISFSTGLWSTQSEKKQFLIVDDEFCNMFSMMNLFLSRSSSQIFVNVLSENYLLRDYMRYNREMFSTNPNAVPSLVPAYSKTERNTVLELVIKMAFRSVDEAEIRSELMLTGNESKDVFLTLVRLIGNYTYADDSLLTVRSALYSDEYKMKIHDEFSIQPATFDKFFANTLRNAYYIIEDEVGNTEYINAKQYGHITQTILPGQFLVYDGKNYEVKYISPLSGVILRRASAVYTERRYYRQLRTYVFGEERELVRTRKVSDLEMTYERCSFSVSTGGYLEMKSNNDLRTAKLVDFSGDPVCGDLKRSYKNKNILKIRLPEASERTRYTVCVLLNELFRSVFSDAWHYLAVLSDRKEDVEGMLNYLLYNAEGIDDAEYIYIVEDSELDLGLLEAIERNIDSIFELLTDYLEWHVGKIRESAYKDPDLTEINLPKKEKKELERNLERKGLFSSIKQKIALIFGSKAAGETEKGRQKDSEKTPKQEDQPMQQTDGSDEQGWTEGKIIDETDVEDDTKGKAIDETEIEDDTEGKVIDETEVEDDTEGKVIDEAEGEDDTEGTETGETKDATKTEDIDEYSDTEIFASYEDEGLLAEFWDAHFQEAGIISSKKSRYQKECYLKYGFEDIDNRFELAEVIAFFRSRGYSGGALKKARKRSKFDEMPEIGTVNHCDFCGMPLNGVSYDCLDDGRVRCNDCSATAISDVEEFKNLFISVKEFMEGLYGISYEVPIKTVTADAETIAAARGRVFVPSTEVAARVLGFARQENNKYSIVIENGSPRVATIDTIIHEMTHIWQYLHWDRGKLLRIYGDPELVDMVYEGMAVWASVQFMYMIGEDYYAAIQEKEYELRNDIYGSGFRYYRTKYPLQKEHEIITNTPFKKFPPL